MSTNAAALSKEKVVKAALALALTQDWGTVTLADIAQQAGLGLATLHDYFEDKHDVLTAYGRMIDQQVLKSATTPSPNLSPRDALFDLIMTRIETLNNDRAAVQSILRAFKCDPKQAIISLPHLGRSMSWMLEAAGISTAGMKGAARIVGLTFVYLKTLHVWMDDDGADLSLTMAALDKNLAHAENLAKTFRLGETS